MINNYSISGAICWDHSIQHLSKVCEEGCFKGFIHLTLGLLELCPIIGQIVSLIEYVFVKYVIGFPENPQQIPPLKAPTNPPVVSPNPTVIPANNPTVIPANNPTVIPANSEQQHPGPLSENCLHTPFREESSPVATTEDLSTGAPAKPTLSGILSPFLERSEEYCRAVLEKCKVTSPNIGSNNPMKEWFFIATNEDFSIIDERLPTTEVYGNVAIGVSGIHNLCIFKNLPNAVNHLILIDPDPAQKKLWEIVIRSIKTSDHSSTAIVRILAEIPTLLSDLERLGLKENLFNSSQGVGLMPQYRRELLKFAFADEGWRKIKDAVHNDRIIHCPIDLTDHDRVASFAAALRENGLNLDTLYVSNVHHWTGPDPIIQSVNTLLNNQMAKVLIMRGAQLKKRCFNTPIALEITRHLDEIPKLPPLPVNPYAAPELNQDE